MMRDDVLKRKMRSGRPEPTPEFAAGVRKALTALPKRGMRPALPRFVPASAIVFAAVAVLAVLAVNNKTIVNFFSPGAPSAHQQLAAGGDATEPDGETAAAQTPLPTPEAGGASQTVGDSSYYQKVGESKTDNGITETLVEVAADPYMLYAKFEFGPVSEEVTGNGVSAAVGGKPSTMSAFIETNPVKGKDGYYVTTYKLPLLGGAFSSNVTFNSQIERNTTTPGEDNKILAHFKFDVSMDLWKGKGSDIAAEGSGTLFYGNKATLLSVFQSPQDVAFRLALEDNESGDLAKYFNKYIDQRGNGTNTVIFGPEAPQMLNMLIYKGLADEGDLGRLLTPVEGPEAKVVFDEVKGKLFLKYTIMLLERGADGKYYMAIVIMNPALRADTDLSLITNSYVMAESGPGEATNNILQIHLTHKTGSSLPTPNPSSAGKATPEPTPTPIIPETTDMPTAAPEATTD